MPPNPTNFQASFKVGHKHKFAITGTGFVLNPPPTVVFQTGISDCSWGKVDVVIAESSATKLMIRAKLTSNHKPSHGMGILTVTVTNNDGSGQSAAVPITPIASAQVNYDDSPET